MKHSVSLKGSIGKAAGYLLLLIGIWELTYLWIRNPFVFPSPVQVIQLSLQELTTTAFWNSLLASLSRILVSTLLSVGLALITAFLALTVPLIERFANFCALILQTIPSVAYLIVLLFWFHRNTVILLVIFFLVYPVSYFNFQARLNYLKQSYGPLLSYYPNSYVKQIRFVYLPHMVRVLFLNLEQGSTLAIKSCIMAEILVSASTGIGASMQHERLFLNLEGVFSWILWLICLSFVISYGIRAIKMLFFKTYL